MRSPKREECGRRERDSLRCKEDRPFEVWVSGVLIFLILFLLFGFLASFSMLIKGEDKMQRSQEIGVYKEAVSNTFRITFA
jgi:ABC-type Fe3+ transport system permease subunit